MAGLLAYAAEGAVAGAGKGLEQVGAASLKDQMDQGIVRLQNQYATTRQQAEFGHQEAMQQQQQKFETERTEKEIQGHSATAHFVQEETGKRAAIHEAESTKRSQISANSRVEAARLRADASGKSKASGPKPWQLKNVTTSGFAPGPGGQLLPQTTTKPLLFNPNTGDHYIQTAGKWIRWDAENSRPQFKPESLNRDVDPGELQRLYAGPNEIIPQGKGAGLTNLENFERIHHYLPAGVMSRMMQGGVVNDNNPIAATGGGDQSNEDASAEAAQSEQEREDNEPAVEPE